jgi:hypothetical protein
MGRKHTFTGVSSLQAGVYAPFALGVGVFVAGGVADADDEVGVPV